ncbi:MAG: amidohydrolase family protein, partial [Bacteroidota bacterium]
ITNAEANKLYQSSFDQDKADRGYRNLAAKGLFVTPTFIGSRQLAFLDENDHMQDSMMTKYLTKAYTDNYQWRIDRMKNETPEQRKDRKEKYKLNLSQLTHFHNAGITILAGSDEAALNTFVYPAESLIDELHIFQEAGLKPIDILRTATINGAKFFKKEKMMGSIDNGKAADLVILGTNPLEKIDAVRHVIGVFTKGKYSDRKALDQILADVRTAKLKLDNSK